MSFLNGNTEVKLARNSWKDVAKRPRFVAGDLYKEFSTLDWTDVHTERNIAIWQFKGSVPFEAVSCVLETIHENGLETVSETPEGTLFMFSYVTAPGKRLRSHLGENHVPFMDLQDQEILVERTLRKLRNQGICPLRFSPEEATNWEALLNAPEVLQCRVSDCVLAVSFVHRESRLWSPNELASLMGCTLVKLRRTRRFEEITTGDVVHGSLTTFPAALVEGRNEIVYGNCLFTDEVGQCILGDGSAYLLPLESVERFPELKPYAALIHYIFYRLQTLNTTINHKDDWPEIRFPFNQLRGFVSKQLARVICHKPEQAMKTILSVAIAWVYCFIRGFNVAMILRNVGARHTGLVGLSTKGVGGFNAILADLMEDVRGQFANNGWDFQTTLDLLSLKVKTDQGVKWGVDSRLKTTRRDDIRREVQLEEQASKLATEPGILLAFPMNVQSLEFFTDMMVKIDNIHRTMVCIDEADEPVASFDRDETKIEKALYPQKAGPGGFPLEAVGRNGNEDDDEVLDDEEWRRLLELFKHKRMKSVPHVIMVTATILPILFTNHDTAFFVMEMAVAPNYIGISTPPYCISRVEVNTDGVSEEIPGSRHVLTSDTWWQNERSILHKIYHRWENITHFRAVLITTAGTTNMIAKQVVGAQAIVENTPFAITAVVNNGRFSCIYFSRHFHTLTSEGIRRRLMERLMGSSLELGEGVILPQLEIPEGARHTKMLAVPNSFRIIDKNTKEPYKRQHPSTHIEIVLASFDEMGLPNPRCAFLETEMICGREKSYVSFSRREMLTDLYYNFPAGRNATTTSQVWGRVCGVFVQIDPILRERRIWTRKSVKDEQLLHKRIIRCVLDLLERFPGSTIEQINTKVLARGQGITDEHLVLWNEMVGVIHGAFNMTPHVIGTGTPHVPLTVTKSKHQVQTRRIVSEFKIGKRQRTSAEESSSDVETEPATEPIAWIKEVIREVIHTVPPRNTTEEDDFLTWFCEGLDFCNHENTPLPATQLWNMLLSPWFRYLAPDMESKMSYPPTGILAGLVFIKSAGNRISRADFTEICTHLSLASPEVFIRTHGRSNNGQYIVQTTDDGDLKLDQAWCCCLPVDGNALRPPTIDENHNIDEEFLRKLVDDEVVALLNCFWSIVTKRTTPLNLESATHFPAPLPEEWQQMPPALEAGK